MQFTRDPERLEIGQRAAAAQMSLTGRPADHARDFADGFLFHD